MQKRQHPTPCRAVKMILHIELPITVLYAVVFLISYLMALEADPVWANIHYKSLLVYLLYPSMITAFSILLIEHLEQQT